MFLRFLKNLKNPLLVISWITILFVLILGFKEMFFFIPNDEIQYAIAGGLSFLLLIYLGFKYEKMSNEIYKWKNKDQIINKYNQHIFEDNEKR